MKEKIMKVKVQRSIAIAAVRKYLGDKWVGIDATGASVTLGEMADEMGDKNYAWLYYYKNHHFKGNNHKLFKAEWNRKRKEELSYRKFKKDLANH